MKQLDPDRCKKTVYVGDWARGHQCTRKASVDGYCKQHHPNAVQMRRDASNAKFQAELAKRRAMAEAPIRQIAALEAKVLTLRAALERIATGQEMTGVYSLADVVHTYQRIAMDAIAKTEG